MSPVPFFRGSDRHEVVLAVFTTLARQGRFGGNIQMSVLSGDLRRLGIDHELLVLVMRPGDEEQNARTVEEFLDLLSRWRPRHVVLYALWLPWLGDEIRRRTGARVMTLDPAQPGDIPAAFSRLGPQQAITWTLAGARSIRAARRMLGEKDPVRDYAPSFEYRFLGADGPVKQDLAFISLLSCPYGASIAANPVFRGLGLGREVSRRGCSYCNAAHDYAPMTDGEKQRRLEHQIRYLVEHLPDLTEIALAFPEDYLRPLARAVRGTGLAGIRPIVFSGQFRSESILEREAELDDLLTAMEERGLEFHMNVVGLESFLDEDLRLFNRGSAAGVRESLEALGRLRSRHAPRSFMPETTGSFILFHPWQTVEGLRRNVEAMRAEGVASIFHTINVNDLRFHPGVALYHLARRDGLIGSVREHRVQDVPLGGYFAESPWIFRDGAVASVHGLYSYLANRTFDRIGLLEACLRQVEQRPATVPGPAAVAGGLDALASAINARPSPARERLLVGIGASSNVGYPRSLFDGRRFTTDPAVALKEIDEAGDLRARLVTITGPEPTLQRWLPDVVRAARERGAGEVEIVTYGRMLTYPRYAAGLVAAGTDAVVFLLHHPEAGGHDAAVRVDGAYQQATTGMGFLAGTRTRTVLAAVVGPENRGRLGDMARLAGDVGATELRLVVPLGNLDLDAVGDIVEEASSALDLASGLGLAAGFDAQMSFRWSL